MLKRIALLAVVGLALTGCEEERPYDTHERPTEEITTRSLDTNALWLYMPSTGAAPRYAMTQMGFAQGSPKLVTLRFDEDNGIYAEEVDRDKLSADRDSRWDSDINRAPVLKIPGEFRQYRCATNDYDECTNKEEINTDEDLDWHKASHFVPSYEELESLATDRLTWYTASNVEETATPRVISYEFNPEEGVINVELERTFTADPEDQYQFGYDLDDYSFKTRFFYSLVKLDRLATPDYKPVYYQGRDRTSYGFFKDTKKVHSATGEAGLQGSEYSLLNRFAPGKESIDYYLSDSYHEEGNELFLNVTLKAIDDINKVLIGTGVPKIDIVNKHSKAGVHPGDLRYNVLNLITDPMDNNLLGYGPSATNPLTGEIVHAHVNQYSGVIRSLTRRTWTNLVMRYNRQEIKRPEEYKPADNKDSDNPVDSPADTDESSTASELARMLAENRATPGSLLSLSEAELEAYASQKARTQLEGLNPARQRFNAEHPDQAVESFNRYRQYLNQLAEQNAYSADFMWLSTQSKGLVKGIDYLEGGYFADDQNTTLKDWDQLTAEQQSEVSDAISAHMYRSTLVHELGHNLGLRHNFMGSVDKAYFYTEEEAKALGMDTVPAYSSIMDYAASEFDELPIYGKYDIAALRFGYNRQIEASVITEVEETDPETNITKTIKVRSKPRLLSLAELDTKLKDDYDAIPQGTVPYLKGVLNDKEKEREDFIEKNQDKIDRGEVKIPDITFESLTLAENQSLDLASHDFCTDGNVSVNNTCNRFDEGTNIREITEFRIQRYWDSYETRNKRNGRLDFHDFHQYSYFLRRWDEFQLIRDVIEDVEEYDSLFARMNGFNGSTTNGNIMRQLYYNVWKCDVTAAEERSSLCDTYEAALTAADFFLDIMTRPDMVCELEDHSSDRPVSYRFVTLSDLWKNEYWSMSSERDVPLSCFDQELVETLARPSSSGSYTVVRSQTRDGRIEATLKANSPYRIYSSEVDLLGTWPDKLLAAQMLTTRDSPDVDTEYESMALMDLQYKKKEWGGQVVSKIEDIYEHMLYRIGNPDTSSPEFVNQNGETVKTIGRYVPGITNTVDDAPSYLWRMKRYFGLTGTDQRQSWYDPAMPDTPTPMFHALIHNLVTHARADEYGLHNSASLLIDILSLSPDSSRLDMTGATSFPLNGVNYVAARNNLLARAMLSRALLKENQVERVEKLDGLYKTDDSVAMALKKAFGKTKDSNEAKLVAIADYDSLELIKNYYSSKDDFKRYIDEATGDSCYRVERASESEEQRLLRKCIPLGALRNALSSANLVADERMNDLYGLAADLGKVINSIAPGDDDEEKIYNYDPELLRLWSSNDYRDYRQAFEQLPVASVN